MCRLPRSWKCVACLSPYVALYDLFPPAPDFLPSGSRFPPSYACELIEWATATPKRMRLSSGRKLLHDAPASKMRFPRSGKKPKKLSLTMTACSTAQTGRAPFCRESRRVERVGGKKKREQHSRKLGAAKLPDQPDKALHGNKVAAAGINLYEGFFKPPQEIFAYIFIQPLFNFPPL